MVASGSVLWSDGRLLAGLLDGVPKLFRGVDAGVEGWPAVDSRLDFDKIAQHLEEKYPQHSLKTPPQFKQAPPSHFQHSQNWLKSKNADDPTKQEYLKELKAFNDHLQAHVSPFIVGREPTNSDFALTPKLRHARIALGHYMSIKLPEEYATVHKYIEI
ncbi:hypothetical protein L7F22_016793 [Adiantum nelumboides]|nr:hypothetical protein [Adiantum nelumboides]